MSYHCWTGYLGWSINLRWCSVCVLSHSAIQVGRNVEKGHLLHVVRRLEASENAGFTSFSFPFFGSVKNYTSRRSGVLDTYYIILYTNICRKRIPHHMLRLNRILTHPFQIFSWVQMHGYLVVRCFGFLLGERENVESFVPEFRCHCIQHALSLTDSWVSFHPTDAHAQIHITVYATWIHRYTDIQIYIYIYIHIQLY